MDAQRQALRIATLKSVIPSEALRLAPSIAMRSRGTCWLAPPQGRPDVRCGKLPDARAVLGGEPEDQAAKQEKLQGLSSQAKRSDSALRIATLTSVIPSKASRLASSIAMRSRGTCWFVLQGNQPDIRYGGSLLTDVLYSDGAPDH